MKVCVVGAGAIGGYLGAKFARAGADVSLVARGAHLAAMRRNGVRVIADDGEFVEHPRCTDDPAELGPQDYVVVALKAHSVPGCVDTMQPLLGNDTAIVTAVNGIPYWYFHTMAAPSTARRWRASILVPSSGSGSAPSAPSAASSIRRPRWSSPASSSMSTATSFRSASRPASVATRVERLAQLMEAAGLKAPILDNIRDEIWLKLWGNLSFNPISALTHATLDVIAHDPGTRAVARAMMLEAKAIGDKLGVHFRVDVERRIDGAGARRRATRPRCCRISSAAAQWRSTRWSRSCRRWARLVERADADDRYGTGPGAAARARRGALSVATATGPDLKRHARPVCRA